MILPLALSLFLFAVVVYKKPALGLGLILALLPAYLVRFNFAVPTTFLELLVVVFLFMVLVQMRRVDWRKLQDLGAINYAALLFLLAGAISAFFSPAQEAALGQLKAFIVEPILFFYASIVVLKSDEEKRTALQWLFTAAAILSLFGLVQYFTYLRLPIRFWGTGDEMKRITSLFEYPNAFALYLAPLIGLFGVLWQNHYELFKKRGWYTAGLVAMLGGIVLTFSRGAWVALLLAALILGLRKIDYKKILGLVAIVIILLAIPAVRARLSLGLTDASSTAHGSLIKIGAEKILGNPWLGNGLAGFPETLRQAQFTGEILNYPHNIFLNLWLELGLLGLIAFALIINLSLRQHHKKATNFTLAAGVFLMIVILHGLVDVPYFKNDLSLLFWFAISLFFV